MNSRRRARPDRRESVLWDLGRAALVLVAIVGATALLLAHRRLRRRWRSRCAMEWVAGLMVRVHLRHAGARRAADAHGCRGRDRVPCRRPEHRCGRAVAGRSCSGRGGHACHLDDGPLAPVIVLLALAASAVGGAAWASIAAFLRAPIRRARGHQHDHAELHRACTVCPCSFVVRFRSPRTRILRARRLLDALHLPRIAGAGRLHIGIVIALSAEPGGGLDAAAHCGGLPSHRRRRECQRRDDRRRDRRHGDDDSGLPDERCPGRCGRWRRVSRSDVRSLREYLARLRLHCDCGRAARPTRSLACRTDSGALRSTGSRCRCDAA